jgi:hypothetical protein
MWSSYPSWIVVASGESLDVLNQGAIAHPAGQEHGGISVTTTIVTRTPLSQAGNSEAL